MERLSGKIGIFAHKYVLLGVVTAKEVKRAGFQERKTALIFCPAHFYRTAIVVFITI